jgi:hypothetical protein
LSSVKKKADAAQVSSMTLTETPWRLVIRFFQPYYWKRNPVQGIALDQLKE